MSPQQKNIAEWLAEGKSQKSIGFFDICDTFDFDHYPVYYGGPADEYKTADEVRAVYNTKPMQKIYGVFKV